MKLVLGGRGRRHFSLLFIAPMMTHVMMIDERKLKRRANDALEVMQGSCRPNPYIKDTEKC